MKYVTTIVVTVSCIDNKYANCKCAKRACLLEPVVIKSALHSTASISKFTRINAYLVGGSIGRINIISVHIVFNHGDIWNQQNLDAGKHIGHDFYNSYLAFERMVVVIVST